MIIDNEIYLCATSNGGPPLIKTPFNAPTDVPT